MKSLFVSVLILLCSIGVFSQKAYFQKEEAEVKKVIDQLEYMMESEDMEIFSNIISHDENMINFGTDAAERWVGFAALKESVEMQFDSYEDGKVDVKDQVIKMHKSGEVAWFSQVMDWSLKAGGNEMAV